LKGKKVARKYAALAPPGLEWQIGKTAASISFVNETNTFLMTCNDSHEAALLRDAVEKVKSGLWILLDWLTPQEYLDQQKTQ